MPLKKFKHCLKKLNIDTSSEKFESLIQIMQENGNGKDIDIILFSFILSNLSLFAKKSTTNLEKKLEKEEEESSRGTKLLKSINNFMREDGLTFDEVFITKHH